MAILGTLVVVAVFAPVIAPYDPIDDLIGEEPVSRREAPCIHLLGCSADRPQHLMGIDGNVRDQFSRVVYGTRLSLLIGFTTVGFAIVVGMALGSVAGFFGGWLDNVIMRLMDVLLAFPSLLLAIAIVAVLGPGLQNALLAIAIVSIPSYARVMRASVLAVKETEFVVASKALGSHALRILATAVFPNAVTPLIVVGTLGIATAILDAAALSFLGLGAQPPTPEWGTMLGAERNQVFTAPHLVFFPGLAIMVTVLGFNLLGDGLRDALDPRLAAGGTAVRT
jgi:ABC-type dipeptide/oligopeptide/nickel transport system permease subunit